MTTLASMIGMTESEFRKAVVELCDRGLVTCTSGAPGNEDATYALAWLPLDNPDQFSEDVRRRHTENMKRLGRCRATKSNND